MPESPEDMLEYRKPYDVLMEVEVDIRCCLNDDLRPMIARLKRSAVVTPEELARHWEETKKVSVYRPRPVSAVRGGRDRKAA